MNQDLFNALLDIAAQEGDDPYLAGMSLRDTVKKLFLIEYENMHWCGGSLNVVVWAIDEDDAREVAEDHMETEQRELFMAELEDEPELEEDSAHTVNSVEEFDPSHDQWQWFADPQQRAHFYPVVGYP